VDRTPTSWSGARDYCRTQGGFLATISSEFEQAFLRLLVSGVETWTGLNDIKVLIVNVKQQH
jgi:hypothetical protein